MHDGGRDEPTHLNTGQSKGPPRNTATHHDAYAQESRGVGGGGGEPGGDGDQGQRLCQRCIVLKGHGQLGALGTAHARTHTRIQGSTVKLNLQVLVG